VSTRGKDMSRVLELSDCRLEINYIVLVERNRIMTLFAPLGSLSSSSTNSTKSEVFSIYLKAQPVVVDFLLYAKVQHGVSIQARFSNRPHSNGEWEIGERF
jgi:hypothetical protein